jgi:TolB protein
MTVTTLFHRPRLLLLAVLVCLALTVSSAHAANPPSRKIAFERDGGIWVANFDGSDARRLDAGQGPRFSPDGMRVTYNTNEDDSAGSRNIAVFDLATGKKTVVPGIPSHNCFSPCWSPDGKQLLFEINDGTQWRLGVINADGTGFRYLEDLTVPHHDYWAAIWAPDGKSLFAQDLNNVCQLDLTLKPLHQWPVEKLAPRASMSSSSRLDISPDGKWLLVDTEMDEDSRPNWDGPPEAVWLVNLATETGTRLTPKDLYAWDCRWLNAPATFLFTTEKAGQQTPLIFQMPATGKGTDSKLVLKHASAFDVTR